MPEQWVGDEEDVLGTAGWVIESMVWDFLYIFVLVPYICRRIPSPILV